MHVTKAILEDINTIAEVHCECWKDTYRFIPKEIHQLRSLEFRRAQWTKAVETPLPGECLFALKTGEKKVVGFTYCRPNEDAEIDAASELHATYVLKTHRGGIAGPLLKFTAMNHLQKIKKLPMCFWAFDQNRPAMIIHRSWGWKPVVKRQRIINGVAIDETGFFHPDQTGLLERLDNFIASKMKT